MITNLLSLIAFVSFATGNAVLPECKDNFLECILPHFGKNTADDTPDTYAGLSDVGVAKNFVLNFTQFYHIVHRPAMSVAGLNGAIIQNFTVDHKSSKATVQMYFPEVHVSGVQQVRFFKAGEDDVNLEYPFDYKIPGITVTAEYHLVQYLIKKGSQKISAKIDRVFINLRPAKLQEALDQHPWLGDVFAYIRANIVSYWQSYMDQFGPVVYNLYWERILALA